MVSAANYLEQLKPLTNGELALQTNSLFQEERLGSARVIAHLAEMARRKAYLPLGYTGLFDYSVKKLGMSEGGAWARGQVARAALRVPALLEAIAAGKISLTAAGKLAKHLTLENFRELLDDCAGMTTRAVKEYLVRFEPKPEVSPGIRRCSGQLLGEGAYTQGEAASGRDARPLPLQAQEELASAEQPAGDSATVGGENVPSVANDSAGRDQVEGATDEGAANPRAESVSVPPRGQVEPCHPETYNIRFAAGRDFKEKLERFAEVLGVPSAEAELANILEHAVDIALDRKDPQRRHQRRQERLARKEAAAAAAGSSDSGVAGLAESDRGGSSLEGNGATQSEGSQPAATYDHPERPREVPIAVRDAVFERAGHCCEYVAPDGTRCGTRVGLTIEHDHPFACDGTHDESNLRAYCGPHNQLRAEQYFGVEFIQRQIARRKASNDVVREASPPYGGQPSATLGVLRREEPKSRRGGTRTFVWLVKHRLVQTRRTALQVDWPCS